MFYIAASTESNYLKLLMIIGNVKPTVTHMEFEKKNWGEGGGGAKKGYSTTIWENVRLFILQNVFSFFAFCYISLMSGICRQQPKYEIRRSILLGSGKLFCMQE